MIKRRSFFRLFGAIVTAVALAPEIAFRTKLPLPGAKLVPIWFGQYYCVGRYFSPEYIAALRDLREKGWLVP